MVAAAVLLFVVIVYRVVLGMAGSAHMDWMHNFSPLAAITLCGAIYLPRRTAIAVPLLALFISDLALNLHYQSQGFNIPLVGAAMLPTYLALHLVAGAGWLQRGNPRP